MKTKRVKDPTMEMVRPLSSWMINNFPTILKNRYAAYCKASNTTMRDHLEYLIAKTLREAGVDIPPLSRDNQLVRELMQKEEGR